MKKSILILFISFSPLILLAQNVLPQRDIIGIVIDSTKQTVIGASVKLTSDKDTILTSTNVDGKFVFKNVKSSKFTLVTNSLGFISNTKSYQVKENVAQVNLDPVVLKVQLNMLDQVVVDGTPTIVYKTDTMEYRASDYKVKENATVEDLVKKMDGMEVDRDGAVTVQGEAVTRARINGKDYFGGDVASAIRDLPSDIVDKIQIVDDYGDEAARTGIKDGDPRKVLNIVTKANKRVGMRGRVEAGVGNDDRYELRLNANRFDGNQQIGIRSNLNNTVTGIAGGNEGDGGRGGNSGSGGGGSSGGGSGGTRRTSQLGFNYNDDLSKKIKLNSSYNFSKTDNNSENSSTSEEFLTMGTVFGIRNGNSVNNSINHNFNAKLEYEIDSANWLIFTPEISFRSNESRNFSNFSQTGAFKQDQINRSSNTSETPTFGFTLNYGHRFNKKGTVISLQLSANTTDTEQARDAENNIIAFDSLDVRRDSLLKRLIYIDNLANNYRSSLTFSHPLTEKARLEFNAQVNYRGYDNSQITNVIDPNGFSNRVDSLSRIFNYSFTESRFALNYRFREKNYSYSLGLTAVPAWLQGESQSRNNTTKRTSFNLIPIFRYEYQWSKQKKFTVNYNGRPQEPSYDQIQDVPDVTNPQSRIIGNPELKAAFRHDLRANFNNYIIKSKLTLYAGAGATYNQNQVIRNTLLFRDSLGVIRETRFMNADGNYNYTGNYGISKRFPDNKYAVSYDGNIGYNHGISMSDNVENVSETWSARQRVGVQITPQEWLEIVPNVRYTYSNTDYSLASSRDIQNSIWALSMEGKVYIWKTFLVGYDISKNFVSGINSNITSNPLIINSYLTKEFFKKKNGTISLRAFDLLSQNNFVSRQQIENGFVDTRSNALSRYFMLHLSWSPQKWSGGGKKSGNRPQSGGTRRGDGSFTD